MKKIYVGNLAWSTTDAELQDLFAQYGSVQSARVITDRETGRSRGFGFVEMDDGDAPKAITELDGRDLGGRRAAALARGQDIDVLHLHYDCVSALLLELPPQVLAHCAT